MLKSFAVACLRNIVDLLYSIVALTNFSLRLNRHTASSSHLSASLACDHYQVSLNTLAFMNCAPERANNVPVARSVLSGALSIIGGAEPETRKKRQMRMGPTGLVRLLEDC